MEQMRVLGSFKNTFIGCLLLVASLSPVSAQVTAAISGKVVVPAGMGVGGAPVSP